MPKIKVGDLITNRIAVPNGYQPPADWERQTLPADTLLEVVAITPKVIIQNDYPWQDSHRDFLLCRTHRGGRAWVNIDNAVKYGDGHASES